MIPVLIGAAAVGIGAALLSDDKPKQEAVTKRKRNISEKQVQQRINRAGRRVKTIGEEPPEQYSSSFVNGNGTWEATTTIINRSGIHARPASVFVQKASSFRSKIQLRAKGKTVDAKSILMIMSMGLVRGTEVTIVADGSDARQAVNELRALIDSGFGE